MCDVALIAPLALLCCSACVRVCPQPFSKARLMPASDCGIAGAEVINQISSPELVRCSSGLGTLESSSLLSGGVGSPAVTLESGAPVARRLQDLRWCTPSDQPGEKSFSLNASYENSPSRRRSRSPTPRHHTSGTHHSHRRHPWRRHSRADSGHHCTRFLGAAHRRPEAHARSGLMVLDREICRRAHPRCIGGGEWRRRKASGYRGAKGVGKGPKGGSQPPCSRFHTHVEADVLWNLYSQP